MLLLALGACIYKTTLSCLAWGEVTARGDPAVGKVLSAQAQTLCSPLQPGSSLFWNCVPVSDFSCGFRLLLLTPLLCINACWHHLLILSFNGTSLCSSGCHPTPARLELPAPSLGFSPTNTQPSTHDPPHSWACLSLTTGQPPLYSTDCQILFNYGVGWGTGI